MVEKTKYKDVEPTKDKKLNILSSLMICTKSQVDAIKLQKITLIIMSYRALCILSPSKQKRVYK